MRLYAAISKVEAQNDGTVRVEGIASSEAEDDQGETILAEAMRLAIPDYMKFPALREMHQLSAAGTTLEADVGSDGMTRIVAHVVDPVAVTKVKNQVYRGFSVGGQVTARDTANRKIITGLKLNEISLVDRPANPEAVLDCWKAAATSIEGAPGMEGLATLGDTAAGQTLAALLLAGPAQVWTCGIADHQHTAKAEAAKCLEKRAADVAAEAEALAKQAADAVPKAVPDAVPKAVPEAVPEALDTAAALDVAQKAQTAAAAALAKAEGDDKKPEGEYGDVEYADPGYQDDKKPRYPVDSEKHIRAAWSYINKEQNQKPYSAEQVDKIKAKIVAAWKDKIDKDGPPSASEKASHAEVAKALFDVGHIASIILELDWLKDALQYESLIEGDGSPQPAALQAIIAQLCDFLNAFVAEETAEILDNSEIESPMAMGMEMGPVAMSAIITSLQKTITDTATLEALVSALHKAGAKHNASDQAHLDLAAHCTKTMMAMDGPSRADKVHLAQSHDHIMAVAGSGGAAGGGGEGKPGIDTGATSIAAPAAQGAPPNATQDTGHAGETAAPQSSEGAVPASPMPKASDASLLDDFLSKAYTGLIKAAVPGRDIAELMAGIDAMLKAGAKPHQVLMDTAHKCLQRVSDGATCKAEADKPARHSGETMAHLDSAHIHLTKMDGCKCDAGGNPLPGGDPLTGKAAAAAGSSEASTVAIVSAAAGITQEQFDAAVQKAVSQALAGKTAENLELAKTVVGMAATLDRMSGRVEAIYQTPLPGLAIARTAGVSLTKAADNGGGATEVTQSSVVDALAAMSPQDQTLTMIKAAQRKPDVRLAAVASHDQYRTVPNR